MSQYPPGGGPPAGGYPPQGGQPPGGGYPPAGPPQGGYPAGGGYPQEPPRKSRLPLILSGLALVVALVAAAIIVPPLLSGDEDVAVGEGETFLEPGEIFLQPATEAGPDPFSATKLNPDPPLELALPVVGETEVATTGSSQVASNAGGEPGLYGGTQDQASCDLEAMIAFLADEPEKAAAWVAAQNTDPNLRWDRGTLTTADLEDYLRTLTPVLLRSDTRVTNHGFRNGSANPIPAVLQAGTAVLVDPYGVPRARCACGNPLVQPTPSDRPPTYVGNAWQGFSPSNVTVVVQTSNPVSSFTLIDPRTGQQLLIRVGTTVPTSAATPTPTPTPSAGPTPTATAAPSPTPTPTPPAVPQPTTPTQPTTAPQPTAPATTPPPATNPQISVAPTQTHANGDVDYSVQLTGYAPNTQVTLTCGSSAQPTFYSETVTTDANGEYFANPFCFTPDPGLFVFDDQGNRSS